jgi:transposase InsO family protein
MTQVSDPLTEEELPLFAYSNTIIWLDHSLLPPTQRGCEMGHRTQPSDFLVCGRNSCLRVTRVDERWSMDFVTDQLADGRYFRVFTVVDQFSRECVALHAAISIRSKDVGEVLDSAIGGRSAPSAITCDNGTEFTSRYFDAWAYFRKIDLDFIRPGKPVENAFIESFNGRFRDECLNQDWFTDLDDAQAAMAAWKQDYNESRPHTSAGGLGPPAEGRPATGRGRT